MVVNVAYMLPTLKIYFVFWFVSGMDPTRQKNYFNSFQFISIQNFFYVYNILKIILMLVAIGCHLNFIEKIFFHGFQIQENSWIFKFFHVGILANFFMFSMCNRILINWLNKKSQKYITLEKFWEAKRQTKKIFYQRKPL